MSPGTDYTVNGESPKSESTDIYVQTINDEGPVEISKFSLKEVQGGLKLTWQEVEGAVDYEIYRARSDYEFISLEKELLGENMIFFSPYDDIEKIDEVIGNIFTLQNDIENDAQFNENHFSLYFKQGDNTSCFGSWRPEQFNWEIAQAAPMRRIYSQRAVNYDWNYGWASDGYVADSIIEGITSEGKSSGRFSGQQFYTRNSNITGNAYGTTLNAFYQGVIAPS